MKIEELTPEDIGREVEYKPVGQKPEFGYITSFNERFVFVCYDKTGRGKATPPEKLEFTHQSTKQ